MQVKTIRKNIEMKMNQWLETITDVELRKSVKKNILVSGGSITSMFLNEKVNDYDVYLMDQSVLIELCKYYAIPHGVVVWDGRNKSKIIEENGGEEYLSSVYIDGDLTKNESKLAVAIRNLKESQVKLYITSSEGGKRVNEDKEEDKLQYFVKFFSPNAISLSDNVQIICRFNGNAEEIHKTFDFIHATNYFTFEEGLVTNKAALESILTKQLKYQGSLYPVTTIIRIKKFLKRGWNITAGEMLKVMFQISDLDLSEPDVLEEQLIGVDIAYFGTLIDILRNVPKEKHNSAYISSIIDKVFNESEDIEQ